jgi:predicted nucleic acid-binding protein
LPITLDDETADKSWGDTLRLAEAFRLSVYDATYLELAQRRRLPLASMDRALRTAATALGVEVLLA